MQEPFDNSWSIVKGHSRCPFANGAVSTYNNKRAFTNLDVSHFGSSISGSGGSDYSHDLTERGFAQFRMPIRGKGDMMTGVERFDTGSRAQSVFQPINPSSAVSMSKAHMLPNKPANISHFENQGDPTAYLDYYHSQQKETY